MNKPQISICIITKNEEKHIDECLKALKKFDVEVVVADTGSTDKTVEIAKKYTDKVFYFEWCDDFSKAKNFVAEKASNDYIVSIDADEYIEKLYEKVTSLYHLDQSAKVSTDKDRGPLPKESVILLSAIAAVWVGIGAYLLVSRRWENS